MSRTTTSLRLGRPCEHQPVFECGTAWSPLAEGPFFNGTLVPKIQLAILKTSKNMSWPCLARPKDLVGSLVWRGDDRATETFAGSSLRILRRGAFVACNNCCRAKSEICDFRKFAQI